MVQFVRKAGYGANDEDGKPSQCETECDFEHGDRRERKERFVG